MQTADVPKIPTELFYFSDQKGLEKNNHFHSWETVIFKEALCNMHICRTSLQCNSYVRSCKYLVLRVYYIIPIKLSQSRFLRSSFLFFLVTCPELIFYYHYHYKLVKKRQTLLFISSTSASFRPVDLFLLERTKIEHFTVGGRFLSLFLSSPLTQMTSGWR